MNDGPGAAVNGKLTNAWRCDGDTALMLQGSDSYNP
jgi:hypothetical protein